MTGTGRVGALIVGLLVGTAGCVADDGGGATATSASLPDERVIRLPGLTATLEQYREDEIQGFISVKTSNQSSSTVEFRDLRLQWPGVAETEPHVRSTQLAPGVTFDIRVLAGEAVCGDPPQGTTTPPPGAAVAIGSASIDGAAPELVAVPVDDERSILPRVYERSCQDQRLTWAAALRFGDDWNPTTTAAGKPALLGSIELSRNHSDEKLTITEINGSVLLRITATSPSDPVVTLAAGDTATTIPIMVEQSGNCSPHALIESKKSFIIPIGFAVGADEPTAYVITFDTPAREVLDRMISESCGLDPAE